jgi:hypothetical protein
VPPAPEQAEAKHSGFRRSAVDGSSGERFADREVDPACPKWLDPDRRASLAHRVERRALGGLGAPPGTVFEDRPTQPTESLSGQRIGDLPEDRESPLLDAWGLLFLPGPPAGSPLPPALNVHVVVLPPSGPAGGLCDTLPWMQERAPSLSGVSLLVRSGSERGLGGNASFRERATLLLWSLGVARLGERRSWMGSCGLQPDFCVR